MSWNPIAHGQPERNQTFLNFLAPGPSIQKFGRFFFLENASFCFAPLTRPQPVTFDFSDLLRSFRTPVCKTFPVEESGRRRRLVVERLQLLLSLSISISLSLSISPSISLSLHSFGVNPLNSNSHAPFPFALSTSHFSFALTHIPNGTKLA